MGKDLVLTLALVTAAAVISGHYCLSIHPLYEHTGPNGTDCSGKIYGLPNKFHNVTFCPEKPKRGSTLKMTINITLGMEEQGGYGECKLDSKSDNSSLTKYLSLCELHSCPIAKGLAYIDIDLDIPKNATQGHYSGGCAVFYGTRAYIFCVHIEMDVY